MGTVGRRALFLIIALQTTQLFSWKKPPEPLDFWAQLAVDQATLLQKTQKIDTKLVELERKLFFFDRTINKSLKAIGQHGQFLSDKGRESLSTQVFEIKKWCSNSITEFEPSIKDLELEIDTLSKKLDLIEALPKKNKKTNKSKPIAQNNDDLMLKNLLKELCLLAEFEDKIAYLSELNGDKNEFDQQINEHNKLISLLLRRKLINQNSSFIDEKIKKINQIIGNLKKQKDLIISKIIKLGLPENITKEEIEIKKAQIHKQIEELSNKDSTPIIAQDDAALPPEQLKAAENIVDQLEKAKTLKNKGSEILESIKKTAENCDKLSNLISP